MFTLRLPPYLIFIVGFGLIPGVIITNVRDMTGRAYKYQCPTPSGPYIEVGGLPTLDGFEFSGFNVAGISSPAVKIGRRVKNRDDHGGFEGHDHKEGWLLSIWTL
jgi:hypothetical protein